MGSDKLSLASCARAPSEQEDREAFAREYWPGGVDAGTKADTSIKTGTCGNASWDAAVRAIASARTAALSDHRKVLDAAEAMLSPVFPRVDFQNHCGRPDGVRAGGMTCSKGYRTLADAYEDVHASLA